VQNPTYLERSRHGVFYMRWPLPKRLHPSGKASCVKISLRTREPRQRCGWRGISAIWQTFICRQGSSLACVSMKSGPEHPPYSHPAKLGMK